MAAARGWAVAAWRVCIMHVGGCDRPQPPGPRPLCLNTTHRERNPVDGQELSRECGYEGAPTECSTTRMGDARSSFLLGKRALPVDRISVYRLTMCLVPRWF
jgi:hypothetical protein